MKNKKGNKIFPKISFVGCGNIAHVHMNFLLKIGAVVSAVCDGSKTRAALFSEKYKIPKYYVELLDMLHEENPDVLHILTPPHTHYDLIMKGLLNGCNVFVEKPFCLSLEEANTVIDLANEKGLKIRVDHTRVYNEMIIKARDFVKGGYYGKLLRMEYDYDDPALEIQNQQETTTIVTKTMPKWVSKIKGGIITDLLPHPLSVFFSFDKGLDVCGTLARIHHQSGMIEEMILTLSSPETIAIAKFSLNIKPLRNALSLQCQKGTIKIDLRNFYAVYLPQRNLPNIVSRVVNTFSEIKQVTFGFISSMFRILLGKLHPYSGLDVIFNQFYSSIMEKKDDNSSTFEIKRVVELTVKAVDYAMKKEENKKENPKIKNMIQEPADCLITGGTGFIGSAIVRQLINSGKKVRILCRSSAAIESIPEGVSLAFGDMKDKASLVDALDGINTVFHCASAMSGDWAEFYESTVLGTNNLLEAMDESSAKQFVYLSSLSVINYSNLNNGGVIDETSPIEQYADKRGFYTRAKKESELLVKKFAETNSRIRTVILRPGLVYGRQSYKILQNAGILLSRFLLVFGMGRRYLGLVYLDNLVDAIILSGDVDCSSGKVYQVVDSYQPTVSECIKIHNKFSQENIIPIYIPVIVWKFGFWLVDKLLYFKDGKFGTFSYRFASNSKRLHYHSDLILSDLKWKPRFNYKESMKRIFFI
jgi:2-alkyl-3-oxoalkanoate reductase